MKQILKRIFHHEELTREEACALMQKMTGGEMNEAQMAALLAAFQMRGITVDELAGFRDALLQACVPIDLHEFHPIDIVGTGGDGKIRSIFPRVPALWWQEPAIGWRSMEIMEPRRSVAPVMSWNITG